MGYPLALRKFSSSSILEDLKDGSVLNEYLIAVMFENDLSAQEIIINPRWRPLLGVFKVHGV